MAITVEFDGRYHNKISNVAPNDIILREKSLFVKGIRIPAMEDRLYDLFYFLEAETRYKHGKVSIALLVNGDIQYQSSTSNNTADYYASKILGFGSSPAYYYLQRSSYGIPQYDEYLIGQERIDY